MRSYSGGRMLRGDLVDALLQAPPCKAWHGTNEPLHDIQPGQGDTAMSEGGGGPEPLGDPVELGHFAL
eukprot:3554140-Lingulodinium_polyedra.AAC.1